MANNFLVNKKTFILILLTLMPPLIFAHPHINIQAYSYNYFNKDGLQGIYMQWEFDPMFSSQLIYNYDTDENMTLSDKEIEEIKNKYFSNISDSGYYTTFKLDKKQIENPTPVSFKAVIDIEDEIIILSFYIPLDIKYNNHLLSYNFSDSTGYTAFLIPQRDLWNKGSDFKIIQHHINKFGEISFIFNGENDDF